jgi:glycosyltransferase involved in cell wall biosynthesis
VTAVAIVIPTCDDADKLLACLGAMAAAVPAEATAEVVVVDDAHDPGLADRLAARFPGTVLLRSRQPRSGGEAARFCGVEHVLAEARAELVAFTDADCRPSAGWLEAAIGVLARGAGDIVTGPVVHGGGFAQRLTALVDFGEMQARAPRAVATYPGCNVVMRRRVLVAHPYVPVPHGDRLHSWQLHRSGVPILYDPGVTVHHDPDVTRRGLVRRRLRYGAMTLALRRRDPTLPGAALLRLGPLAPFLLAGARAAIDLGRLVTLRRDLGVAPWELPLFAAAVLACRVLDCYGMLRPP